jgi:hypothetical protein
MASFFAIEPSCRAQAVMGKRFESCAVPFCLENVLPPVNSVVIRQRNLSDYIACVTKWIATYEFSTFNVSSIYVHSISKLTNVMKVI